MLSRCNLVPPFWVGDRLFTDEDLVLIRETARQFSRLSRSELAATLGEILPWKAPNGKPRALACLQLLEKLEGQGVIKLRPKVRGGRRGGGEAEAAAVTSPGINVSLSAIRPVVVEPVPGEEGRCWNATMAAYHPLGYRRPIGAHQRYWIRARVGGTSQIVGAMLFGAAAKALADREAWIGWTSTELARYRWRILNNNRFLILPEVHVPHLASHVLSLAVRRLPVDWQARYGYRPVLLETFVETPYRGTCYRAANWILVGHTQGRGRQDRYKEYALSRKTIWMYPLVPDWREQLTRPAPAPREAEEEEEEEENHAQS